MPLFRDRQRRLPRIRTAQRGRGRPAHGGAGAEPRPAHAQVAATACERFPRAGPRFHTDARLCCSVDDFVSDAEIAEIRRLGEPLLQPSYIQRQGEDGEEEDDEAGERSSLRTSWS